MAMIDRLLVIWGEPTAGNRQVVGHLARVGREFHFWYESDLSTAFARGFRLLPQFPRHRGATDPYVERYLFPLFAERIPGRARPDAASMMSEWGVERPDDQFEVLAKSGGIRATDRLELAEFRDPGDDLSRPLEFRVAGRRYIDDPAPLSVGDIVSLRRDPHNDADPNAVIVDAQGRRAGYVPRQYTALVGTLLDRGQPIDARIVRKIVVPEDVGRWVVSISRRIQVSSAA